MKKYSVEEIRENATVKFFNKNDIDRDKYNIDPVYHRLVDTYLKEYVSGYEDGFMSKGKIDE